jgi:hypothetical protein
LVDAGTHLAEVDADGRQRVGIGHSPADQPADGVVDVRVRHAVGLERATGCRAVGGERQEKVLTTEPSVVKPMGFALSTHQNVARAWIEAIEHRSFPPCVLAVNGLFGDAETTRDLLPRPALLARAPYLQHLEPFDQLT